MAHLNAKPYAEHLHARVNATVQSSDEKIRARAAELSEGLHSKINDCLEPREGEPPNGDTEQRLITATGEFNRFVATVAKLSNGNGKHKAHIPLGTLPANWWRQSNLQMDVMRSDATAFSEDELKKRREMLEKFAVKNRK